MQQKPSLHGLKAMFTIDDSTCLKRKKHLALSAYCEHVRKYIATKEVKTQFQEDFEGLLLDRKAEKGGYLNSKRLAIIGGRNYQRELENKIANEGSSNFSTKSHITIPVTIPTATPSTYRAPTAAGYESLLGKRELDQLYAEGDNSISVGTRIKRQALVYHKEYQKGTVLSEAENKIMSCGLSSILDIIDQSPTGQMSLFDRNELDSIVDKLTRKYKNDNYKLPEIIKKEWNIIVALAVKDNNLDTARRYLAKIKETSQMMQHKKISRVFETLFDIMENHNTILDNTITSRITEYDYLLKIWGPLLESVISINGSFIRMKSGESINSITSQNKRELYDSESCLGFKIDLRFVFDSPKEEYDVGAGEVAKDTADNKLNHDLSKLVREGKDVFDGLLNTTLDDETVRKINAPIIQICGLQCQTSSVHLIRNGLYVAVPQNKLKIPTSISDMKDFINMFEYLYTFVCSMEQSAHNIKKSIYELEGKRLSMGINLNRPRTQLPGHSYADWMRPNWYSPPRDHQKSSKLPTHLFNEKCAEAQDDAEWGEGVDDEEVAPDTDEFGWYESEGIWINALTNARSTTSPYE